jgi:hypothetical protein
MDEFKVNVITWGVNFLYEILDVRRGAVVFISLAYDVTLLGDVVRRLRPLRCLETSVISNLVTPCHIAE